MSKHSSTDKSAVGDQTAKAADNSFQVWQAQVHLLIDEVVDELDCEDDLRAEWHRLETDSGNLVEHKGPSFRVSTGTSDIGRSDSLPAHLSSRSAMPKFEQRYSLSAAASTNSDQAEATKGPARIRSEVIRIEGVECWFEYSEGPEFLVYLCGNVPTGVVGFEASGRRWKLRQLDPGLYEVPGLELYQIDEFNGDGTWTK